MPSVARLTVYPIKSLDGRDVNDADLSATGSLSMDRVFALVDDQGRFFNGKRDARVHQVRAKFSPDYDQVSLSMAGQGSITAPLHPGPLLNEWFSEAFGLPLELKEKRTGGFPDDEDCPGPTVTSLETLRAVGRWFFGPTGELDLEELHRRFRTNILLEDCPAFYEDSLYGDAGGTAFLIGDVRFLGIRASARCAVPSRDSRSGQVLSGFQKRFVERRREELPEHVDHSRFDHYYRLCVNTIVPRVDPGDHVRVGDPVRPEFSFDFQW